MTGTFRTPLVAGSGIVRERIITAPNLERLRVAGMFNATFTVDPSFNDDISLRFHADDNILRRIQARVRAGVIHIGLEPGAYRDLSELSVTARVGRLRALASSGTAQVLLQGACGEAITLSTSGASRLHARGSARTWRVESTGHSQLRLELLPAERVDVAARDSSRVELDGETDVLTLHAYGAARVHATANHAHVDLAGVSSASVAARRSVSGRVRFPCHLSVACPGSVEIAGAYRSE